MLRSLLLATATLAMAAQTPAPEAPKTAAVKAAPAPKAAPRPKADPVLATIGKEVIRQSDFDMFIDVTMNDQQKMQMQFVDGAREQYLKRFLEFKALAVKARREGLQNQPDHAKKLAIMDMQLLIQALMEKDGPALQAKAEVKDADVKAYFDAHPDKFKTPETFSARHILIGTRAMGDKKGLTDEEAKAKAEKVLAEIKAGKSFADAAKEYSDDPGSKDKGGLYEDTAFGRFVPEFDQAVRSQPVGKVGEPVKTMYGYHLIEVEKITPAVAQTFDQVKDQAREQAASELQEQVMAAYLAKVKKEVGFKPAAPAKAASAPAPAAQAAQAAQ